MRFRAEQRLRRQLDFRTARERGRRIECGGFTLWYVRRTADSSLRNPGAGPLAAAVEASPAGLEAPAPNASPVPVTASYSGPRVGVVASTASVGNAVRRNRAKRRLRDIFRRHQDLVPGDVDLLLVARNSLNRLEYAELERKFVEACRRVFASKP